MKNLLFPFAIVILIFFALTTIGCADKEAEAEIARLSEKNVGLQHTVDSLQHTLDSLNAYSDSVKKSLQKLDMGL